MSSRIVAACAITLPLVAAGCAAMDRSSAKYSEQALSEAGFEIRYPHTPAERAHLESVKQRRILRLAPGDNAEAQAGNEERYVYADRKGCDCLYVGTRDDYARYQAILRRDMAANQRSSSLILAPSSESLENWGAWESW